MNSKSKSFQVIAFYLPQYHAVPENDCWWGKGFTEWTNVGKAKPLYHNHYQPKVPADLGYYNLMMPEVREQQAILAREAGIDAFCYWHYWFGNGKQLLEKPLEEVVKLGTPDFPFCLGWANHSWMKKNWNSSVSRFCQDLLLKQEYPGMSDIKSHFYKMLPVFQDERYYKICNKLLFLIYNPMDIPYLDAFLETWQELAVQNNLPGFYFIAQADANQIMNPIYKKFDAINYDCIRNFFNQSRLRRAISYLLKYPIKRNYKCLLKEYNFDLIKENKIYPTIYPNWDVTPRMGYIGTILNGSTPELFSKHVLQILSTIQNKPINDHVVFLKSWNEWAEGNYMEPDLKFGKQYICKLHECLYGY